MNNLDNYLLNSDLEAFCKILKDYIDVSFGYVDKLNNSINPIKQPTTEVINSTFALNSIDKLGCDINLLFNGLDNTINYNGICNILVAIFKAEKIDILYNEKGNLIINLIANNPQLFVDYVDKENKKYIDKNTSQYLGFKAGKWESLQSFLKMFLNKYLPAGSVLEELNIALDE